MRLTPLVNDDRRVICIFASTQGWAPPRSPVPLRIAVVENLEFLGVILVGILVAGWYFHNEEKGADGDIGLLALKPDVAPPPARSRGRYRIKPRRAARARDARTVDDARALEDAPPAYRAADDATRARRRFRRQDEARYRVKDKMTGDFTLRDHDD